MGYKKEESRVTKPDEGSQKTEYIFKECVVPLIVIGLIGIAGAITWAAVHSKILPVSAGVKLSILCLFGTAQAVLGSWLTLKLQDG